MSEAKKDEKVDVEKLKNQVNAQGRLLDKLVRKLEEQFGQDYNGDGLIGKAVALLLALGLLVSPVMAEDIANWSSGSGLSGSAVLSHDGTDYTLTVDNVVVDSDSTGAVVSAVSSEVTATASTRLGETLVLVVDDLSVPIINGNGGTGTNWTGGVKIFDFHEGLIDIESVLVSDVIMATNPVVASTDGGDWALGTTIEAGNTLATSTAVDLCPSTSADPWVTTNSAFLAAGVLFDGTATAKDLYFNVSVDSGDLSGATTVVVDQATITVNFNMCGDD